MEKQQVLYIHGGESFSKYENFLERLRSRQIWDLPAANPAVKPYKKWTKSFPVDLGERYEVFMPEMPNKQNAKYEEWKIWFERHFEHLNDGVILMGCSLGAMFLTKYFVDNQTPFRVRELFIMACPIQDGGLDEKDCGDFVTKLEDVKKLAGKADTITIMHSTDDFVVPYEHAVKYKEALPEAELVTFTDKNHFLIDEFPELVERIKALR